MSGLLVSIGDAFQVRCEREEVRPVSVATDAPTQRLRAFKHRLDPNASQLELLGQYAGAARGGRRQSARAWPASSHLDVPDMVGAPRAGHARAPMAGEAYRVGGPV